MFIYIYIYVYINIYIYSADEGGCVENWDWGGGHAGAV